MNEGRANGRGAAPKSMELNISSNGDRAETVPTPMSKLELYEGLGEVSDELDINYKKKLQSTASLAHPTVR